MSWPARHAGEYQCGVAFGADLRAETQPLGDARPEPLHQHVSGLGQAQQRVEPGGVLEVQADRPPAPAQRVDRRAGRRAAAFGPLYPQHVSAEVGQNHTAEWRRRQARDLDDPDTVQWTHLPPPLDQ